MDAEKVEVVGVLGHYISFHGDVVEIPQGWALVPSGKLQVEDKFYNPVRKCWQTIYPEIDVPYYNVLHFHAIIRKGN
jgi:hypothetical protein